MNNIPDPNKLQLVLNGETDIIVRRDFTHPPARVWRALTDPKLIPHWLGEMKRCEMDARPGGSFHYEWTEFAFFGPVLAADAPHHMTHVEHFSGDTSYNSEITTELVARGCARRAPVRSRPTCNIPGPSVRPDSLRSGSALAPLFPERIKCNQ